jgi:hypothetical protein
LGFLKFEEDRVVTNDQDVADDYEQQQEMFEHLVGLIIGGLGEFGFQDTYDGDYSVYEDYWGYPQVKLSISNLKMLEPFVIEKLQKIIQPHPGWEVVVAVVNRSNYSAWPKMGLYIRQHEIIDGLQRQYFPTEFRNIEYRGARSGTEDD